MKVLLTGGSGFVASHCLERLLGHGHDVVFTVRSEAKAKSIMDQFPGKNVSYAIVTDIAQDNAFDEAVKSDPPFDAILHTASPFHYNVQDPKREMLDPAVNGTIGILRAAKKNAPSVRTVVITSSFAAMAQVKSPPAVYNEDVWNPMTLEETLATKNPQEAYRGSKKLAEKAAWDFMEAESPHFDLVVLNPPFVLGPPPPWIGSLDELNTSNQKLLKMLRGVELVGPSGSPMWVDVRDLALAHVLAIEKPEAANQRFFVTAGRCTDKQIGDIIRKAFPDIAEKIQKDLGDKLPPYDIDNRRSAEVLGLKYRSLEDTIVTACKALRERGA